LSAARLVRLADCDRPLKFPPLSRTNPTRPRSNLYESDQMSHLATDEQLIAEFATGRRAALEDLARRYEKPLLGLSQGLLGGDATLAQDAVQETWVRVIRFAKQFNGRSSFKTWVYRIAINQCRSLQSSSPHELKGNPGIAT